MYFKKSLVLIVLLSFLACKQETKETTTTNIQSKNESNSEDKIGAAATNSNWLQPPYKYWAFKNMDKIFDVGTISKGKQPFELEKNLLSLADLKIEQFDGEIYGFEEHLDSNRTDGFLVLHKGKIICEKYYGNMTETSTHNWFSVSKSLIGTTIAILAAEGKVDLQKPTLHYMPELKGTAWEGTTVQMILDMLVGIQFNEIYDDVSSDVYKFSRATHFVDMPDLPSEFDNVLDYFKTIKKGRNHNELFHYVSLNTELLGMIITKVTGKQPSEIMSEKIWSKLGAEQDAFLVRDPNGYEIVSASTNSNLRDAGRFGQMVLNDGYYNGQQIVPKPVIQNIAKGGSIEKFADSKRGKISKNFSYKNQWWHTNNTAFFAKGLFGQWIYIDPATELVIVKFTTSDIPSSTEYDWINNMNLMKAIQKRMADIQ